MDIKKLIDSSCCSADDKQTCILLQKECERLLEIGKKYRNSSSGLSSQCEKNLVRQEFATGGFLHRGVYCPSPIMDIVVGNLNRGKILKKPTGKSKINHKFGFDASGLLIRDEQFYENSWTATEYLIYAERSIYGITIDRDGLLSNVSEEIYADARIREYRNANYCYIDNDYTCFQFREERYSYDNIGLASCDVQTFHPDPGILQRNQYHFYRQDGYLAGYTVTSFKNSQYPTIYEDGHIFKIAKIRKA